MSFEIIRYEQSTFEDMKKLNEHGAEYWSARDLHGILGYAQWRDFEKSIKRAMESCQKSGNVTENHFAQAHKMVEVGSKAKRGVHDYHLSRFACYLIAQNGDPSIPEIANAQKYFAVQTRRQEISDQLAADMERLEIRRQATEEFKALSGAAREAGVQNKMFGVFHDAGYKGLYGGIGKTAIQRKKGIPEADNIMDRMNTTELAANQFRMTQTRDKLKSVYGEQAAIETHESVGREVREAIHRIGGTMPENIPAVEHIKQVEKRVKSSVPKLHLAETYVGGLMGQIAQERKE